MSDFWDDLGALGFRRVASRRTQEWTMQANGYLSYSLSLEEDGSLAFSWELAIGELLRDKGLQIGSNDPLNLFLFPQADTRGPAEVAFVAAEMQRVEQQLSSFDLSGGR